MVGEGTRLDDADTKPVLDVCFLFLALDQLQLLTQHHFVFKRKLHLNWATSVVKLPFTQIILQ